MWMCQARPEHSVKQTRQTDTTTIAHQIQMAGAAAEVWLLDEPLTSRSRLALRSLGLGLLADHLTVWQPIAGDLKR